jgi:hypothetical protein
MRTEKRIIRKRRKGFYEVQIKQAEHLHIQKESRRFYWLVNDIRKEFRPHIKALTDSNGLILNETPAIMNRWKYYFQDLQGGAEMEVRYMRKETEQETNEVEKTPNENEYLTIEDITDATEKLKITDCLDQII